MLKGHNYSSRTVLQRFRSQQAAIEAEASRNISPTRLNSDGRSLGGVLSRLNHLPPSELLFSFHRRRSAVASVSSRTTNETFDPENPFGELMGENL